MNRKTLFILFVISTLFLSMGVVCADNATGDLSAVENPSDIAGTDDVLKEQGDSLSFKDLSTQINSSSGELEITDNYAFNNQSDGDYKNGIKITNRNLTINGNNHVIDASGKARIFSANFSNIIIKNLVFKNSVNGAIFLANSTLTTFNVTFENNSEIDYGGAIHGETSVYNSMNDKFIDNYAKHGSAIYLKEDSSFNLNNGFFKSNKMMYWGLIYLDSCQMDIVNTTFNNVTSLYTPALFASWSKGKIRNSRFTNLYANITAGAIGFKSVLEEITIENCDFINTSCEKNGGAIYADIFGGSDSGRGQLIVDGSRFINCSAEFGGAILQVSSSLSINNTNFTSNIAKYDGGAVYASLDEVDIINSNFISNKALTDDFSNGGACYFDCYRILVSGCIFRENSASVASSIYGYNCELNLEDSYFKNPGVNNASIYIAFMREFSQKGNNFTSDVLSLNNTDFETNVKSSQRPFTIINNTIAYDTLPERFDLRDYGWLTPIKNQGDRGSCWAFGNVAALESALIRYLNITYDFSENNVQNLMLKYSKYGVSNVVEGGEPYTPVGYLVSWLGISPLEYDTYDELGKISPLIATLEDVHVTDVIFIPAKENLTDNYRIKKAIIDYGALAVSCVPGGGKYYNETTYAQYFNGDAMENHRVCVVGWDDNFSKYNFAITPPGDGAFIVRNSWGTEFGDGGYFYISYYDTSFASYKPLVGYVIKNNISYDAIYQHDISGDLGFTSGNYYMNKFVAEEDALIAAVGTFFEQPNLNYEFSVFVNDVEVCSHKGTSEFGGYSTIPLDKYVSIKKGDEFKVIFKNKIPVLSYSRVPINAKVTFGSDDGKNWEDLSELNSVAILKVYTLPAINISQNMVKYYGDETPFVVNVSAGENVTFEINGITATVMANNDGVAVIGINLTPSAYTINLRWNNTSIVNYILIKSTIDASDATRGYNSNYNYPIKLLNASGEPLKNADVNVTINGKTTKFTTDNGGAITVSFKQLTSSQTVSIVNSVNGETVRRTVKVVSRFSDAANINMYYFDGSKFSAKVYGDDGKLVGSGKIVVVKLNKKTYKVKTNKNGVVSLKIPNTVKPGSYALTVTYAGQTIKKTVKVKQVLSAGKFTVKNTSRKLVLKASLKNGKKAIKNKKITFTLNGKKYVTKTNKNGIAKKTLKKNVIKKLKKGKTYIVKVTYLKDTIKTTLKVRG